MPGLRRSHPPATRTDPADPAAERLAGRQIEPNRQLRGHAFLPPAEHLAEIPGIAAARRVRPAQRIVWLHYFTGYTDWYVCGLDQHTDEAYGYVIEPTAGISQWSYCSLHTMCLLIFPADPLLLVRRDLHWQPSLAAQLLHPPGSALRIRPSSA
jgi:hypothetical protein